MHKYILYYFMSLGITIFMVVIITFCFVKISKSDIGISLNYSNDRSVWQKCYTMYSNPRFKGNYCKLKPAEIKSSVYEN